MGRYTSFAVLGVAAVVNLQLQVVDAAYCHGSPNPNAQPNNYTVNTAQPVLLNTTQNGKLYAAGQPGFEFNVVHVYGTPYEMGYAHASLLTPQVQLMVNATWQYMLDQVEGAIDFLPAWLADLIATAGLDVALDVLINITSPFTGAYFYEELRGMADAANVSFDTLKRIHLIGELTQGDCSMYGAWGAATADSATLSLRALDWDTDGPFKDYPAVIVYHPNDGNGHAFSNVGFIGWIGSLSGQSSAQMSIHEIGVSYPDTTYFGNETFVGIPFVFLLRDILQFDNSYEDTVSRITNANRTCDLILGVGDGKANTFRSFAYSGSEVFVFDDTNLQPWNNTADTWHPRIKDVVYHGMDWNCPSYNSALAAQINSLYGKLTPQNTISDVTAIVQTGDVHIAMYDLTNQQLYVSFMAGTNSTVQHPQMAYDRQFTQLNLTQLFAEPAPSGKQ